MHPVRGRLSFTLIGVGWTAAIAFGIMRLWTYEGTPGIAAQPPIAWPTDSRVSRATDLPTLVLLIHPKCPCSRATLAELAAIMTDCRGKLATTVVMLRPAEEPIGWERTDLWETAARIPGVTVMSDAGGSEVRRFGAVTSGQALLYESDGRLLFRGGITAARGHQGDNAGRSSIEALVLGKLAKEQAPAATPVYGCPLSNDSLPCPMEGTPPCPTK
jgi:hypothetical protein